MIQYECACGRLYEFPDDKVGRKVTCRHCGAKGRVPSATSEPASTGTNWGAASWVIAGATVIACIVLGLAAYVLSRSQHSRQDARGVTTQQSSGATDGGKAEKDFDWDTFAKPARKPAVPRPQEPAPTNPEPKVTATLRVLTPEEVYQQAVGSVVVIIAKGADGRSVGIGSGFVAAPWGVVVTNAHVLGGASSVEMRSHAGHRGTASHTLAIDQGRDIAFLPLPEEITEAGALPLASSLPRVGEAVYAIGAPKGLVFTFTRGVVSQIRNGVPQFGCLIQTDASISPGSSGGPLLNARGEVVGVTTLASLARAEAHNLNFAVPSTVLYDVRRRWSVRTLAELQAQLGPRVDSSGGQKSPPPSDAVESECRRLMSLGRNYWRAGRFDDAVAQFRAILTKYPKSRYCAEAKRELAKAQAQQRLAQAQQRQEADAAMRARWRRVWRGMSKRSARTLVGEPKRIEAGEFWEYWYYGDVTYAGYLRFDAETQVLEAWKEP